MSTSTARRRWRSPTLICRRRRPSSDGRQSRASHRLYIAPGAAYEAFADPLRERKNTLLELRAPGCGGGVHQTLIPPSVADGERREWCGDVIAPAVVDASALRTACAWLAIASLIRRYVSKSASERPGPDLPRPAL